MKTMGLDNERIVKSQLRFRHVEPNTCATCKHAFSASDGVAYGSSSLMCGAHGETFGVFVVDKQWVCDAHRQRPQSSEAK